MLPISLQTWIRGYKIILSYDYIKRRLNYRFLFGIIKKIHGELKSKNTPWLTVESIKIIENLAKASDVVLEFGSGSSTVWFSKHVKKTIIIEHDLQWYKISKKLTRSAGSKIKLHLAESKKKYLEIFNKIPDNSIDICLVDGEWRRDCLIGSFPKIKTGGVIILDNAETFIPKFWKSNSFQSGWKERGSLERDKVKTIINELKKWRFIVTSDVTQDTIFFIKNA
ncbi:MAG: hypothetical protein US68_C0023G0006 [Candidatus Shapirobacteria bacterium GW2011_GWE1_38_10]|uniref:Class I SAM-dependent methyltransferase n=1 Tax=Candidatus Shapirobacteria bacterium GW2011_GWE1_38_10 TaxID=1618488 RepID=A0A0G0L817_9BACT|nr:MAG: hypothetical protein US46_C0002G0003 [Candidatus Shapirobacteria bacterium GW2011_GWF2_37_20]KKQ48821.1 MAG: hypothetical protein US68_C0023G0006 [Candidatus Shapirobacteria bacterium GW2011_GWE1_38_10]KKQ63256.1 MAG: hypothetical protein US85_C0018G0006 [Candidatus Shapirobacteria bacterium GW2011_GWF1_38_23]